MSIELRSSCSALKLTIKRNINWLTYRKVQSTGRSAQACSHFLSYKQVHEERKPELWFLFLASTDPIFNTPSEERSCSWIMQLQDQEEPVYGKILPRCL